MKLLADILGCTSRNIDVVLFVSMFLKKSESRT